MSEVRTAATPTALPRLKRDVGGLASIDRMDWGAGCVFSTFGVRVGVRANQSEGLERSRGLFPPGWKAVRSSRVDRLYSLLVPPHSAPPRLSGSCLLFADGKRIARTEEIEPMLDAFETDLHMHVAEMAPRRLFVHAGVVGWRGRAIVIPGRSFTGKTTLVKELVKAGATYYSDEFAVLDARGRVHPFARPLAIRDETNRQVRVGVEELGGRAGRTPLSIGLVVVAPYRAGGEWNPRRLSAGQGVLALLAETVAARRHPQRAMATLRAVVDHAPVLKGARGEAAATVDAIFSALEQA